MGAGLGDAEAVPGPRGPLLCWHSGGCRAVSSLTHPRRASPPVQAFLQLFETCTWGKIWVQGLGVPNLCVSGLPVVPDGVFELCSDMAAASWELSSGKAELPRARTGGRDAGRGSPGGRGHTGCPNATQGAGLGAGAVPPPGQGHAWSRQPRALMPAPRQTPLADGVLHGAESSDYRGRGSDGAGKPRLPPLRRW